MSLPVEIYGSPILRRTSLPVDVPVSPEIVAFSKQMLQTMREENGIGLAAPQVGRNIRLFVIDTRQEDDENAVILSEGEKQLSPLMPLALLNAELTPIGTNVSKFTEGCLSIPGIDGEVIRPVSVHLKAQLLDGSKVDLLCSGLLARCLQHENDHLDGVLFVDRMNPLDRVRVAPKLTSLKRRTLRKAG